MYGFGRIKRSQRGHRYAVLSSGQRMRAGFMDTFAQDEALYVARRLLRKGHTSVQINRLHVPGGEQADPQPPTSSSRSA